METEIIPWKTKNEWIGVYADAYSEDFHRTEKAVRTLTEWKHIMKAAYRPGMDFTRGLLDVALKDKDVFINASSIFGPSHLQLMYSAEIMRFLNLVCDTFVDGKKVSLYSKAKSLGIPDWVVNIRHQMAHHATLPPNDILRMAVRYILDWLIKNYWEEEKNGMREMKLENPKIVIPEILNSLLNVYIVLKEQFILGFSMIRDIQDPYAKEIISELKFYSVNQVKRRCKPTDINSEEDYLKNLKNIQRYSVRNAVFLVLKMMQPFFKYEEVNGVNAVTILIEKMIDDSLNYNGLRIEVWKTLLKTLHSWHKFPLMISILVDESSKMAGEHSYQAGMWCVELCKALQKRFKVESLSSLLRDVMTADKEKTKETGFETSELIKFRRVLRKRKLDTSHTTNDKILTCIFIRIEEKYQDLKEVLRLREAIFPERWEVLDLISKISMNPTDFTLQCLTALYDILKWPFSRNDFKNLVSLIDIYLGGGIVIKKKKKIFEVGNLAGICITSNGSEVDSNI